MSHIALEYVIKRACMILNICTGYDVLHPFLGFQEGAVYFQVKTGLGIKKSTTAISPPSAQIQLLVLKLHFDFWLEDNWSQSKSGNLQLQLWARVSTFMYKVADFARRDFPRSCGLLKGVLCITLPGSKTVGYGSTAHCICSALFLKPFRCSCYTTCTKKSRGSPFTI